MTALPDWDVVWTQIEAWCRVVITRVQAVHPRTVPVLDRYPPNEFSAFAAALVFLYEDDQQGDEAGSLSFEAHCDGQRVLLSSDLIHGHQYVCLDGPTDTIQLSAGRAALDAAVAKWTGSLEHFVLDEACPMMIANMTADAAAKRGE